MTDQAGIFSQKPAEMFNNVNYLDKPKDTKFERTIIKFIKDETLKQTTQRKFRIL